jgi:hypothetical protein
LGLWVSSRFNDWIFDSSRFDEDSGRLESTSMSRTSSRVVGIGISASYSAEERSWVSWWETNEESCDIGVSGEFPRAEVSVVCPSSKGADGQATTEAMVGAISPSSEESEAESVESPSSSGSRIFRGLLDATGLKVLTGFLCPLGGDAGGDPPRSLQGLLLPLGELDGIRELPSVAGFASPGTRSWGRHSWSLPLRGPGAGWRCIIHASSARMHRCRKSAGKSRGRGIGIHIIRMWSS